MTTPNDDDGLIAEIPDLRIEISQCEDTVVLEQRDYSGETDRIAIHATQVRLIAEHLGIAPVLGAPEAAVLAIKDLRIAELERDQRRLRLALLSILDRSGMLLRNLVATEQNPGQAELTLEVEQAGTLLAIADLACADFEDEFEYPASASDPSPKPPIGGSSGRAPPGSKGGKSSVRRGVLNPPSASSEVPSAGPLFPEDPAS